MLFGQGGVVYAQTRTMLDCWLAALLLGIHSRLCHSTAHLPLNSSAYVQELTAAGKLDIAAAAQSRYAQDF